MSDDLPLQEQRDLEEFQRLSLVFQFYLELVLKAFVGTLGIAGGVTTFTLRKDVLDPHTSALGILLPAALCFGMGLGFLIATLSRLSGPIDRHIRPNKGGMWS